MIGEKFTSSHRDKKLNPSKVLNTSKFQCPVPNSACALFLSISLQIVILFCIFMLVHDNGRV